MATKKEIELESYSSILGTRSPGTSTLHRQALQLLLFYWDVNMYLRVQGNVQKAKKRGTEQWRNDRRRWRHVYQIVDLARPWIALDADTSMSLEAIYPRSNRKSGIMAGCPSWMCFNRGPGINCTSYNGAYSKRVLYTTTTPRLSFCSSFQCCIQLFP